MGKRNNYNVEESEVKSEVTEDIMEAPVQEEVKVEEPTPVPKKEEAPKPVQRRGTVTA